MTPAVKGMQKAHCLFFIITWAALHNRADQHFDQSAAYCIITTEINNPANALGKRSGRITRQISPAAENT